ncbi:hypothetical protein Hanom_Chr16g01431151 [Helianthus anomalus]
MGFFIWRMFEHVIYLGWGGVGWGGVGGEVHDSLNILTVGFTSHFEYGENTIYF